MWITGNIGIHHIHHLNSRIPYYRLPRVMRDLGYTFAITKLRMRPGKERRCSITWWR